MYIYFNLEMMIYILFCYFKFMLYLYCQLCLFCLICFEYLVVVFFCICMLTSRFVYVVLSIVEMYCTVRCFCF